MSRIFVVSLILLITFVLYGQTVTFDFVNWDDDIHVYNNPAFESTSPLKAIWTSFKTLSYLPVTHSFFYLQWKISHSPHLFHAVNIVLHLINVLLILILLQKLQIELIPAFFITLIYSIHPMRVESVAWVSDQKSLISGVFIWLAFLCYVKYSEKNKTPLLLLTAVFYAFAMLSKQTAFPLPFVFLSYEFFMKNNRNFKQILKKILPLILLGTAIMFVHWTKESMNFAGTSAENISFPLRALISSKSFVYYLLKTIIPANLCPIYPRWIFSQDFVGDFLPPITILLLSIFAFSYYKKRQNAFSKLLTFAYIAYIFAIFPVTGIFTMPYLNTAFIADRYSYFPGVFITIVLVIALMHFLKKWAYIVLSCFSVICLFYSMNYIKIWKNSETFWEYIMKKNPQEDTSYTNLSYYFIHKEEGNIDNLLYATQLAQKAIDLNPTNPLGYYNYGSCLMKQGKYAESESYLKKALELKPDYADVWNDLGYILERQGDIRTAVDCYNKALFLSPDHKVAKYNLNRVSAENFCQ